MAANYLEAANASLARNAALVAVIRRNRTRAVRNRTVRLHTLPNVVVHAASRVNRRNHTASLAVLTDASRTVSRTARLASRASE